MMKRKLLKLNSEVESSFELDLAPMLALMVTLIPIMLLSTVFVRVNVIETNVPQVVQKAVQKDKDDRDKNVHISLYLEKDYRVKIQTSKKGKVLSSQMVSALADGQWNLKELHNKLIELKKSHPNVFHLDLNPSESVPYDDIVKIMDEARSLRSGETKFIIRDKTTNESSETTVMFPEISFGNIMEG